MTRSLARVRTCGVAQCASVRETGCEMEFSCECAFRLHPTQDSQREEVRYRGGRLVTGIFTIRSTGLTHRWAPTLNGIPIPRISHENCTDLLYLCYRMI